MATRWSDPPIVILFGVVGSLLGFLFVIGFATYFFGILTGIGCAVGIPVVVKILYELVYLKTETAPTTKFIIFNNKSLERKFANRRIPMAILYESYINGDLDFKGDALETLYQHRDEFVSYRITGSVVEFLLRQFFPFLNSSSFHSKKADKKEIAEHYDRGNDFFAAFLGPLMVYTSGVFRGTHQSLETAQRNKMSLICDKLQVKEGDSMLDIGCGWGTLTRHAAKYYGAKTTGVTLSVEGAAWCRQKTKEENLENKVTILNLDYRDIPMGTHFKAISAIEMAEHVGITNFQMFLAKIKELLTDDGLFLMQVAGLRQGADWQDVQWGLFMSKYIFPGADASTPLNWYVKQLELAGFEVRSVETIGKHYSHTLNRWYDNWEKNKGEMKKKYGDRLCRLWTFFLAWSVIAAGVGYGSCYQLLAHKNYKTFDRNIFTGENTSGVGLFMKKSE